MSAVKPSRGPTSAIRPGPACPEAARQTRAVPPPSTTEATAAADAAEGTDAPAGEATASEDGDTEVTEN